MFTSSLRALTLFVSLPILCFDFGPALYLSRHMEHGVPRSTTEPHAAEHHHSREGWMLRLGERLFSKVSG